MCDRCKAEIERARERNREGDRGHPGGEVVAGTVTDVSLHPEHGRAKVTLTVECDDGETFEESYDCAFNQTRGQELSHRYGAGPMDAEGMGVNVYTGDNYNHRHILRREPPLKTIGGTVLVPVDAELPVEMQ